MDLKDYPLAVYRPRPSGEATVEIEGGSPAVPPSDLLPEGLPGEPPLVVRFRIPGPEDQAAIEARCRDAMLNLLQGKGAEARYGFAFGPVDETMIASLSPFVSAVESAAALIVDWNYAVADGRRQPVKAAVTPETVAQLFRGRPLARSGWTLQYEAASPLERAEGNVFAASPDTTSATAATTAGDAPAPDPAAAGAASAEPEGPAPAH